MQAPTETTPAEQPKAKREPVALNGVDTPALFATIDAVRQHPQLAPAQFRTTTRWVRGTHSVSSIETFRAAGDEQRHVREFRYDADHPAVLCGADQGPTPVEFLLQALGACLIAGVANIAAARGVTLSQVEARIEGEMDLRGILGLAHEVRNGYQGIRVVFRIEGDAPAQKLRDIVEQSRGRSAVFDVITNRVPIEISVQAG